MGGGPEQRTQDKRDVRCSDADDWVVRALDENASRSNRNERHHRRPARHGGANVRQAGLSLIELFPERRTLCREHPLGIFLRSARFIDDPHVAVDRQVGRTANQQIGETLLSRPELCT